MCGNYIHKKTISLVIKIARFPKKINAFPRQNQIFSESAKGGLFFLLLLENGGDRVLFRRIEWNAQTRESERF